MDSTAPEPVPVVGAAGLLRAPAVGRSGGGCHDRGCEDGAPGPGGLRPRRILGGHFFAAALVFLVGIVFGHVPFAGWLLMGCMLAIGAGTATGLAGARRWETALAALAAESQVAHPSTAFVALRHAARDKPAKRLLPHPRRCLGHGGWRILARVPPGAGLTTLGLGLLTVGFWLVLFALAPQRGPRVPRSFCPRIAVG